MKWGRTPENSHAGTTDRVEPETRVDPLAQFKRSIAQLPYNEQVQRLAPPRPLQLVPPVDLAATEAPLGSPSRRLSRGSHSN